MLPDYPKIKAQLAEVYRERIRQVQNAHLGFFSDVQPTQMQEGGRYVLVREDGSVDEMEPKRIEARADLPLDIRQVDKLEPKEIAEVLDTIGEGLAREKFRVFLDSIDEAVTKVGNVTTPGKPALEQFFEAMEKRMLDFDDEGRPGKTNLLVGSEKAAEKLREIMKQIEADPNLRRRHEAIIEKKRGEWRDREASRNLVE